MISYINKILNNDRKTLLWVCGLFIFFVLLDHRVVWDWMYTHWLYDYHFGFNRRGLVGELLYLALGKPKIVSLSIVKCIAWILFAINVGLFGIFFRSIQKTIIQEKQKFNFNLFFIYFMLVPVSLRNYAYDLGRLDHIATLLIFSQWFSPPVWVTAIASILMVLVHENFIFIFFPAILLLVYHRRGFKQAFWVGFATVSATLFMFKFGKPNVDAEAFWNHITQKADSALDNNVGFLYWTFMHQLEVDWIIYKSHIPYLLGYVFYFFYCIPVYRYFSKLKLNALANIIRFGFYSGYVAILFLSDWCRGIANFFIIMSFMTLYFMKFDEGFKAIVLNDERIREKKVYYALLASLIIPAVGVDIPRFYKLVEIIFSKF